ncbi:hypothetical protein GCM10027454_04280 [Algoriphagus aestuariicola]
MQSKSPKMKVQFLFLFIYFLAITTSYAQEKAYYNQTELGVMIGKVEDQWSGTTEDRVGFSMLTFHGAWVARYHVVGLSLGYDNYESVKIIPVAFGWRGFFGDEGKAQLIGGFDIGGGSTILQDEEKTEWGESWWEGGMMLSPSVGGFFPGKNGKTSLTVTVAYKRQEVFQYNGTYDQVNPALQIANSNLPPGFSYLTETNYLLQSMVLRVGLSF